MVQGLGIFLGVLSTVWCFLFFLRESFAYGDSLLLAPAGIPLVALVLFWWLWKRRAAALPRWFLLEFLTASAVAYLVMRFVVVKLL